MKTSAASMRARMRPLPRRHRIAHLRALLRQSMAWPVRREELAALLRGEMPAQLSGEERVP
jgi:hypothetical protein